MNKFIEGIEEEVAWKQTENGAEAFNTTTDACLDLFSTIGSLRKRTDSDIQNKITKAWAKNALLTLKILFYARDIQQGLGERRVFKVGLEWLANLHPDDIIINIPNIANYGRYDDLYCLVGTPAEKPMFDYLHKTFELDLDNMAKGKPVTLLGKWLKSVNTSSKESNKLGKMTAHYFFKEKNAEVIYRKSLSSLRKYLNIVENQMSKREWEAINFNKIPGGAMKKYTAAFYRHQEERFTDYIDAVKEGKTVTVSGKEVEAKINTKNLYPYEILERYCGEQNFCLGAFSDDYKSYIYGYHKADVSKPKPELEVMWNNLKDWIQGTESNTIVVADTSGSMIGRPLAVSVSLGIYFAEKNTGEFHNKFMTFSSEPSWISLDDSMNLLEKIKQVPDICDNTDLEAAFDLILKVGIDKHLSQDEMPQSLIIITDMEFDSATQQNAERLTFYDHMKHNYELNGYQLPNVVFWNADSRQDTYHTQSSTPYIRMVSGSATSVFKSLVEGKSWTPYEFMLEVITSERYNDIVLNY